VQASAKIAATHIARVYRRAAASTASAKIAKIPLDVKLYRCRGPKLPHAETEDFNR
jgi:hypothetical protein